MYFELDLILNFLFSFLFQLNFSNCVVFSSFIFFLLSTIFIFYFFTHNITEYPK